MASRVILKCVYPVLGSFEMQFFFTYCFSISNEWEVIFGTPFISACTYLGGKHIW